MRTPKKDPSIFEVNVILADISDQAGIALPLIDVATLKDYRSRQSFVQYIIGLLQGKRRSIG